ncbi:MAG: flagellar biosynthetic protein FliO [Woeseiaceae bacterium]
MRALYTYSCLLLIQINQQVFAVESSTKKSIASLSNEPIGVANYVQMFLGLFLIVGIIIGMAWLMRRMSNATGLNGGNLKVLGGVSVGQRERVVLIQAGNTQLLVGVAPGSVRAIHVLDEQIITPVDAKTKTPSGFADKLHAAIKKQS